MDLDLYLYMFKRWWKYFLTIIVVTTLAAWWFASSAPTMYQGTSFISIAQPPETNTNQATNFYDFDEFYSLQGSGFLTRQVEAWVKDPATVASVFEASAAQSELEGNNLKQISNLLLPEVRGNNGLQLTYENQDKELITKILKAAYQKLEAKLTAHQAKGFYTQFSLIEGDTYTTEVSKNTTIVMILGLFGGLVLGFSFLLLLGLLMPPKNRS